MAFDGIGLYGSMRSRFWLASASQDLSLDPESMENTGLLGFFLRGVGPLSYVLVRVQVAFLFADTWTLGTLHVLQSRLQIHRHRKSLKPEFPVCSPTEGS